MSREPSIRLSDKHGVNPTIAICFYCGEEKNEIALLGKLKGDQKAPMRACIDLNPCQECIGHMKRGVILVEAEPHPDNQTIPRRLGGWVVVNESAVKILPIDPDELESVLQRRFAFISEDLWTMVGLPRGESN